MSCVNLTIPQISLPLGISLALPKIALGLNFAINFCCHFGLGLDIELNLPTIGLSIDILAPLNVIILAVDAEIDILESYLVCPFE